MWIEPDILSIVVKNAPLVSIDLIVRNSVGQALLGKRVNRPAKGYWFVPGGRIIKDERIEYAFTRLVKNELGVNYAIDKASFLGPYQHFYSDNFSGTDFSTHYVALGYEIVLNLAIDKLPAQQHSNYRWFDIDELLDASDVHQHTKDYFT
jgi:colanic acid biosynthesis protein WcaH